MSAEEMLQELLGCRSKCPVSDEKKAEIKEMEAALVANVDTDNATGRETDAVNLERIVTKIREQIQEGNYNFGATVVLTPYVADAVVDNLRKWFNGIQCNITYVKDDPNRNREKLYYLSAFW